MLTRRSLLATSTLLAGCAATGTTGRGGTGAPPAGFVRREGTRLMLDGERYRFVGANIWYGAYLGADAAYGNRARLGRELDRLKALGVTNLRILASSEEGPLRNSIKPGFRDAGTDYNDTLLAGLDHLLVEMARRDMKAVLYLTNFWEWSGGMMTYLSYVNGGRYLNANDPEHPWPAFANFTADFYASEQAVRMYHDYVRAVVGRTNSITSAAYADDPTIMAWQLANEPRPGGDVPTATRLLPAFYAWIDGTARLIKSIDANHLVSTGSEGLKGAVERADIVLRTHQFDAIDYLTAHIWPNNWDWVDGADLPGTFANGEKLTAQYIEQHVAFANQLDRPLVIEEFGFPRDGERYAPDVPTSFKDRFYRQIYTAIEADARAGGPLAGSNFWAWNGEGRAAHDDFRFREGDLSYVGDPPHEPQGWYGVFDSDASTHAVIRAHGTALAAMPG